MYPSKTLLAAEVRGKITTRSNLRQSNRGQSVTPTIDKTTCESEIIVALPKHEVDSKALASKDDEWIIAAPEADWAV